LPGSLAGGCGVPGAVAVPASEVREALEACVAVAVAEAEAVAVAVVVAAAEAAVGDVGAGDVGADALRGGDPANRSGHAARRSSSISGLE